MTRRGNIVIMGALVCALAALVLLVSGLGTVELQPGRPFPLRVIFGSGSRMAFDSGSVRSPSFAFVPIILVWVVMPLLLVYLLLSPQARREFIKRVLRWTAITILVMIAAHYWRMGILRRSETAAADDRSVRPEELPRLPEMPDYITTPPQWFIIVVSLVLAGILVASAWWIIRRRRPRVGEPLVEIAQGAEEALAEIRAGGNLRDTVMRCYDEMSRVLQARGISRQNSMTPREFEQQLTSLGVRDEHVRGLTRLFESVRYGQHKAGASEEEQAVASLQAIVQGYGGPR